ncbi:hypothetical protein CYY_004960 [Polysphondylium violaceum]|uniref:EamA domain-containing protein n=1 Tax=Polysphondylium violaceum TaxID=133409 RepID=A0A8J4V4N8_9MYCE|nr:hypothetical protein CYY_004960 [Polysphondylium violaceum]
MEAIKSPSPIPPSSSFLFSPSPQNLKKSREPLAKVYSTPKIQVSLKDVELETIEKEKNDKQIELEEIQDEKKSFFKRFLGIFIIIAVAFFMSTSSEFSEFIVNGNYPKPFMLIYFGTLFNILSVPIELIVLKVKRSKLKKTGAEPTESLFREYYNQFGIKYEDNVKFGMTIKKFLIVTVLLTILFVALNYIWLKALPMTQVSTSNALFQSATIFVFFFSIFILKEKVTILKVVPIVLFMAGVVGITIADSNKSDKDEEYPNSTLGDILMIVVAVCWALYEVLTTKFFGQANRTVVNTYIAVQSITCFVLGIPVLIILHFTGVETLALPSGKVFGYICINSLVGFLLNYLINWGLSVTSPLFVRSGELMTIPATFLFDVIFKNMSVNLLSLPGFVLIILGFILSLYVENRHLKQQAKKDKLDRMEKKKAQQQMDLDEKEGNGKENEIPLEMQA